MQSLASRRQFVFGRWSRCILCSMFALAQSACGLLAEDDPKRDTRGDVELGRELFVREWLPHDSRSHGGDGLGPVFNDTSCAACHNLGGTGGAGPKNKNVEIVSVFWEPRSKPEPLGSVTLRGFWGIPAISSPLPKPDPKKNAEELAKIHPGFKTSRSVVLHRFATDPDYDRWRSAMIGDLEPESLEAPRTGKSQVPAGARPGDDSEPLTFSVEQAEIIRRNVFLVGTRSNAFRFPTKRQGDFELDVTQRNPMALFGAGLIESIPNSVLEEAARTTHVDFPLVTGRVCRLGDGRIGRFGWKAQQGTLREFILQAAATELGLHVPGHDQLGLAYRPDDKAPGFDMNQQEGDALVAFVRSLPAPVRREPKGDTEVEALAAGRKLFAKVGCSTCHTQKLGDVDGIYSDLLLHNIYGVVPESPERESDDPLQDETPIDASKPIIGATHQEWRTPPLWGFRDSGPYLHDGSADTLDQAVAMHFGEAEPSALRFFQLSSEQRLEIAAFLKSLIAPRDAP